MHLTLQYFDNKKKCCTNKNETVLQNVNKNLKV